MWGGRDQIGLYVLLRIYLGKDHKYDAQCPLRTLSREQRRFGSIMSRHHCNRRRAVLAACASTTAILGLFGSTGSAMASITCQSPGYGSGATVQKIAQNSVWLTAGGGGRHTPC